MVTNIQIPVCDAAGDQPKLMYCICTDNVSNPPTDAELDTIYGIPSTVGCGFVAYINNNGEGNNFYKVVSDGTNWWIFTGTKAQ